MRTACHRGHPYTQDNTLYDKHGYRRCRECNRIRSNAAYQRRVDDGTAKPRTTELRSPVIAKIRPTQRAWHEEAICPEFGVEVFVPELSDGFSRSMQSMTRDVRPICERCPVIADCAREALSHRPWGVWAGMAFSGSVSNVQYARLIRLAGLDQREAS